MPRDGGGVYSLPAGNPVVPGTIIDTTWANPTMEDIGIALSDSLSRSGKGGMTASLRGPDGSAAVPTFSFTNEPTTGRYRDGPGQIVEAVDGTPVVRYTAAGLEQWNGAAWEPLTPRDAKDTPFDPGPTALTSTNVQDAIEEVFAATGGTLTADAVTYDDTLVYFPAATVQIAIDRLGIDLSDTATDVANNEADIFTLGGEIDILDTTVQGLVIDVNQNEADIGVIGTWISQHEIDYDALAQRVTDTENDIIAEQNRIQPVSLGGTGVTSATGTGSTVRSSSPSLQSPDLNSPDIDGGTINGTIITNVTMNGPTLNSPDINTPDIDGGTINNTTITSCTLNSATINGPQIAGPSGYVFNIPVSTCHLSACTADTPGTGDNDTSVATTAFVKSLGYFDLAALLAGNFGRMYEGQGNGGNWRWFQDIGVIVQWGDGLASSTGRDVYYPIVMQGQAAAIFAHMRIDGYGAPWPNSTHIKTATNQGISVVSEHNFDWFIIGGFD